MRTLHKGLIIGGATLAVLVPTGIVLADQLGDGPHRQGPGNGSVIQDRVHQQDRTQDQLRLTDQLQTQDQVRARDGTGVNHEAIAATVQTRTQTQTGQPNGGPNGTQTQTQAQVHDGPQDGTGQQQRNGR